jgi:hypothetical protein
MDFRTFNFGFCVCVFAHLACVSGTFAQSDVTDSAETVGETERPAWQWLAQGQRRVSSRVGLYSHELDSWLAGEAYIDRANQSVLKLRMSAEYNSRSGNQTDIEIGGSIDLPLASERWKLVLHSRTDEFRSLEEDILDSDTAQDPSVALRYEQFRLRNFKLDHDVGLRGKLPLTPYYSLRLRYGREIYEGLSISLEERLWYFARNEGQGNDTIVALGKRFGDIDYLSWSNHSKYRELRDSSEFASRLTWTRIFAPYETLSLETGAVRNGILGSYSEQFYLKALSRYPLIDNWLIVETSPQVQWKEELDWDQEFQFTLAIEFLFFAF